jgi:hypothetical protein
MARIPIRDPAELVPYFQQHPQARQRFVGLVSCGKAKRDTPAPARDLYTGGLTRMGIDWMARNCEEFFILSAKYGLTPPGRVLPPYNTRISDLDGEQRKAWGQDVEVRLRQHFVYRGRHFFQGRLLVIAGADYLKALRFPKGTECWDVFAGPGWPMGKRLQWLKNNPVLTDSVLAAVAARNGLEVPGAQTR